MVRTFETSSLPIVSQRVAVIGAGISGLAAAKCLLDEKLVPVVFEQVAEIGGVWKCHEDLPGGGGVMYRSLHTNTSRHTFAFSDFPLSATLPDYPARGEVLQYLQDYATHFGLAPLLRLNTMVEAIEPMEDGHWQVRTRTQEQVITEIFDAVVVERMSPLCRLFLGQKPSRGRSCTAACIRDQSSSREATSSSLG